jgi:predicted metal-dependent enzyme (double-stranded beta helix superfamily)
MNVQPELTQLAAGIEAAVALRPQAMEQQVLAALRVATARTGWLPPERRRVNHENYARHLLYGDPHGRFSILSLVWDHGQRSPVHGHHCWCAVGVYLGTLSESHYREETPGVPALLESRSRAAGSVTFAAAGSGVHRISNESGAVAISLHVYGVAAHEISTRVNRVFAHTG